MAISITEKFQARPPVDVKFFKGNLGTYATGGVAIAPSDVGFTRIHAVVCIGSADATRRYIYDSVAGTVVSYVTSTGAETANGTNLSAVPLEFIVYGQ